MAITAPACREPSSLSLASPRRRVEPLTDTDPERDLDEALRRDGQADAVLDPPHQHQRHDAARAASVDAQDARSRRRRVHADDHVGRRGLSAEEAAADGEDPGITSAVVSKHDHAVLAEAVPARQAVLRPPAQTTQARAAALDAVPPALEPGEMAAVHVGRRVAASELLEVAAEVRFDHVDEAASQNDVVGLAQGKHASLARLAEHGLVERSEDEPTIEH